MLALCLALPACGDSGEEVAGPSLDTSSTSELSDAVELGAATLIARVELEEGHELVFHEVAPGQTEVLEKLPRGTLSRLSTFSSEVSPFDIYRSLRPDAAMPAKLAQAEVRAVDRMARIASAGPALERPMKSGAGALLEDGVDELPGRDLQHSTPDDYTAQQRHDHFSGHGYCLQGTPDEYDLNDDNEVCKYTNWGGGFWAERSAKGATFIVDLWKGESVQIAGLYNTGHCRDWFSRQDVNEVWTWRLNCATPSNVGRRLEINNASGDKFHVAGSWWRP